MKFKSFNELYGELNNLKPIISEEDYIIGRDCEDKVNELMSVKYKIIDQYDFTYHEGDFDSCTDYYNTYKIMWRKQNKLLSIKMEGLDG